MIAPVELPAPTSSPVVVLQKLNTEPKALKDSPRRKYAFRYRVPECPPWREIQGVQLDTLYRLSDVAKLLGISKRFFPPSAIHTIGHQKFVIPRDILTALSLPEVTAAVRRGEIPPRKLTPHASLWTCPDILVTVRRATQLLGIGEKSMRSLIEAAHVESVSLASHNGAAFITSASLRGLARELGYDAPETVPDAVSERITADVPGSTAAAPDGSEAVDSSEGVTVAPGEHGGACICTE